MRLTAEDGYQAQRSYSIASGPEDEQLLLTVERLEDGEVSPYLAEALVPGDELELRGPIGGYFVWESAHGGPLLLIAGGSGIAPFRSVLRHHTAVGSDVPLRLLYSARSINEVIYRKELESADQDVQLILTREWPEDFAGHRGRIDQTFLDQAAWPPRRATADLHLRPERLRRDSRRGARPERAPTGPDQDRAVRTHGELINQWMHSTATRSQERCSSTSGAR